MCVCVCVCVQVCGVAVVLWVQFLSGLQLVSCRASGSEAVLNEDADEEEAEQ